MMSVVKSVAGLGLASPGSWLTSPSNKFLYKFLFIVLPKINHILNLNQELLMSNNVKY